MADCEAELDVCLDLPCVGGAVEKSELHRPFCKSGIKVQSMVAGGIVMLVPVAVRILRIP